MHRIDDACFGSESQRPQVSSDHAGLGHSEPNKVLDSRRRVSSNAARPFLEKRCVADICLRPGRLFWLLLCRFSSPLLVALSVHIFLIGLQQTGIWAQ